MDSGTGISSFGSQKCLNLPGDGRPAWRIPQTLAESNAPPSGKASGSNRPVLEAKSSASDLKEHDYIGLAENSAFDQPLHADVQNDKNELSLDGTDLHLELGLGLGTASTRMNDCEKYADFLLKHKDVLEAQKEGASKAPFETSRFRFSEAVATFQKPWPNARPGTADCSNSANRTTRDYQLPAKSPTFLQDLDAGHSKAGLSNLHCSSVKNGTKRGYTEAMHDVPRFDNVSGVPAAGKAAEKEAKVLPKHQQGPYLPTYLQPKPIGSAHWMVGSEKSSMHAFVPGNEKAITENANVALNPTKNCKEPATNDSPPPKGQVVGWPPIRSYRKQNLAKPTEMFVKVNMEGMTVGRKVDLNAHSSYEGLYLALEEMFQPSSNGAQGSFQSLQGRESHVHDAKQVTLLNGSEYVLTYEDQDGDWMMVGDVPWSMFVNMVRRLRIARKPEATGLAPTRRPEIVK